MAREVVQTSPEEGKPTTIIAEHMRGSKSHSGSFPGKPHYRGCIKEDGRREAAAERQKDGAGSRIPSWKLRGQDPKRYQKANP